MAGWGWGWGRESPPKASWRSVWGRAASLRGQDPCVPHPENTKTNQRNTKLLLCARHGSPDPNPNSSTSKLGDLGQEAATLCASVSSGVRTVARGLGVRWVQSPTLIHSAKTAWGPTMCQCNPSKAVCSPLWMRGFLNFISECYSSHLTTHSVPTKWVTVPKEETTGAKPAPERVGGWSKVTKQA